MNVDLAAVRRDRRVVAAAQVFIVLCLLAAVWFIRGVVEDRNNESARVDAVNAILANTCGLTTFAELQRRGLVEECRLAQDGELPDALPDDVVSDPAEAETEPDVLPDDENATPADIAGPPGVPGPSGADATDEQVYRSVVDYFRTNPLPSTPGYQRAITRAVTSYLTLNPPAPGRPPTSAEIRSAVRVALLANPPAPGSDGVSVVGATAVGCDVVFTLSTGRTVSVGPLCGDDGEPGPPPTDAEIADAFGAYCAANGECRGPAGPVGPAGVVQVVDECTPTDGEYVVDIAPEYNAETQTVTIRCTTRPVGLLGQGG